MAFCDAKIEESKLSVSVTVEKTDRVFVRDGLVYVSGSVNSPGPYEFKERMTIAELARKAGGVRRGMIGNKVELSSISGDVLTKFHFIGVYGRSTEDWERFYDRIVLKEGDMVYFHERYN